jgi:hypothetical protein
MKWLWPLSWYLRIKQLERERDAWKALAKKREAELISAYMSQSVMAGSYSAAIASIGSMFK